MTLLEKIKSMDESEYPRICHYLNGYEIPEDLVEFLPGNWDTLSQEEKNAITTEGWNYTFDIIGYKEMLRYLHVSAGIPNRTSEYVKKTNEEFEIWYSDTFNELGDNSK